MTEFAVFLDYRTDAGPSGFVSVEAPDEAGAIGAVYAAVEKSRTARWSKPHPAFALRADLARQAKDGNGEAPRIEGHEEHFGLKAAPRLPGR